MNNVKFFSYALLVTFACQITGSDQPDKKLRGSDKKPSSTTSINQHGEHCLSVILNNERQLEVERVMAALKSHGGLSCNIL